MVIQPQAQGCPCAVLHFHLPVPCEVCSELRLTQPLTQPHPSHSLSARESSRQQRLPACLFSSLLAALLEIGEPDSPKLQCREEQALGAWPQSLPTDWVTLKVSAPL